MNDPFVSIIVPVCKRNKNLDECIEYCLKLDYPNYEIIVLPDEEFRYDNDKIKIIPTGHMGPAGKRNIGTDNSKGDIIAFIDDDTYPERDWLANVVRHFEDESIGAVGGPAVTPESDTLLERASGGVYSSFLGGGSYRYRYIPMKKRFVDDYPSCNLIVRKNVLDEIGGYQTAFWPGEDTHLCLEIVEKLKKKIIYDPEAVLYHHRRSLFVPHLKQVKAYALHRGYFAKRFPKTSFRLSYFLPTIFVAFLCIGWIVSPLLYSVGMLLYLGLVIKSVLEFKGLSLKILIALGIIATHITYGLYFIGGLAKRKLSEE